MHYHYKGNPKQFFAGLGEKLQQGTRAIGTAKGIWDAGRALYAGYRAVAPVVAALI